jgi:hypothetical protein
MMRGGFPVLGTKRRNRGAGPDGWIIRHASSADSSEETLIQSANDIILQTGGFETTSSVVVSDYDEMENYLALSQGQQSSSSTLKMIARHLQETNADLDDEITPAVLMETFGEQVDVAHKSIKNVKQAVHDSVKKQVQAVQDMINKVGKTPGVVLSHKTMQSLQEMTNGRDQEKLEGHAMKKELMANNPVQWAAHKAKKEAEKHGVTLEPVQDTLKVVNGLEGVFIAKAASIEAVSGPALDSVSPADLEKVNIESIDFESDGVWAGLSDKYYKNFAAVFTGSVLVQESGTWEFSLASADDCSLKINGKPVLTSNATASTRMRTRGAQIQLGTGWHAVEVLYFNNGANAPHLQLFYKAPSMKTKIVIPKENLQLKPIYPKDGVLVKVYKNWRGLRSIPDLTTRDPDGQLVVPAIALTEDGSLEGHMLGGVGSYVLSFTGSLAINQTGTYAFELSSGSGAVLYIAGKKVAGREAQKRTCVDLDGAFTRTCGAVQRAKHTPEWAKEPDAIPEDTSSGKYKGPVTKSSSSTSDMLRHAKKFTLYRCAQTSDYERMKLPHGSKQKEKASCMKMQSDSNWKWSPSDKSGAGVCPRCSCCIPASAAAMRNRTQAGKSTGDLMLQKLNSLFLEASNGDAPEQRILDQRGCSGRGPGFTYAVDGTKLISSDGSWGHVVRTIGSTGIEWSNGCVYSRANSVDDEVRGKSSAFGQIDLAAGQHSIQVMYFEAESPSQVPLEVSISGPGISKQVIPSELLSSSKMQYQNPIARYGHGLFAQFVVPTNGASINSVDDLLTLVDQGSAQLPLPEMIINKAEIPVAYSILYQRHELVKGVPHSGSFSALKCPAHTRVVGGGCASDNNQISLALPQGKSVWECGYAPPPAPPPPKVPPAVSVHTPENHKIFKPSVSDLKEPYTITVNVTAANDAHILLTSGDSPAKSRSYEIALGG